MLIPFQLTFFFFNVGRNREEVCFSNSLLKQANILKCSWTFWLKFNFRLNCTCFRADPGPVINQNASGSKFTMPLKGSKLPVILLGCVAGPGAQFGFSASDVKTSKISFDLLIRQHPSHVMLFLPWAWRPLPTSVASLLDMNTVNLWSH